MRAHLMLSPFTPFTVVIDLAPNYLHLLFKERNADMAEVGSPAPRAPSLHPSPPEGLRCV